MKARRIALAFVEVTFNDVSGMPSDALTPELEARWRAYTEELAREIRKHFPETHPVPVLTTEDYCTHCGERWAEVRGEPICCDAALAAFAAAAAKAGGA